jgi:hypothetical protein
MRSLVGAAEINSPDAQARALRRFPLQLLVFRLVHLVELSAVDGLGGRMGGGCRVELP